MTTKVTAVTVPTDHGVCRETQPGNGLRCTLLPACHKDGYHAHWCPTCKVETTWPTNPPAESPAPSILTSEQNDALGLMLKEMDTYATLYFDRNCADDSEPHPDLPKLRRAIEVLADLHRSRQPQPEQPSAEKVVKDGPRIETGEGNDVRINYCARCGNVFGDGSTRLAVNVDVCQPCDELMEFQSELLGKPPAPSASEISSAWGLVRQIALDDAKETEVRVGGGFDWQLRAMELRRYVKLIDEALFNHQPAPPAPVALPEEVDEVVTDLEERGLWAHAATLRAALSQRPASAGMERNADFAGLIHKEISHRATRRFQVHIENEGKGGTVQFVVFRGSEHWIAQCLQFDLQTEVDDLTKLPTELAALLVGHFELSREFGKDPWTDRPMRSAKTWELIEKWHSSTDLPTDLYVVVTPNFPVTSTESKHIEPSCPAVSAEGLRCTLLPSAHTTYHAHLSKRTNDDEKTWPLGAEFSPPTEKSKAPAHIDCIPEGLQGTAKQLSEAGILSSKLAWVPGSLTSMANCLRRWLDGERGEG